jgi:preprotein translocase subunit SecF
MRILTDVNINWLRWRWHALIFSWLIILAGLGMIYMRGLPLGIDFSGGTLIKLRFEQPTTEQAIQSALAGVPGEKVVQRFGEANGREFLVRLPQAQTAEQGFSLEQGVNQVMFALKAGNLGKFEVLSTEVVGPVIGRDLQRKGIYATIGALLGIMTYISLRFRFSFGVGAMVASLHDVLVTLSCLTLFGYELSLNVVAAILTLTGYGVNDQIVIFDRVRENLHKFRREPMDFIINTSVNQTLPRTVITAGTTLLSVLSLYLFGGDVLEGFAFAMLVGIITSTYSTVFIASAIAVMLSQRKGEVAAPAKAGAGVKPATTQPGGATKPAARSTRASRKAKAS